MSDSMHHGAEWQPCPSGTLNEMVRSIRAEHALLLRLTRRRFLTGALSVVVIMATFGVTILRNIPSDMAPEFVADGPLSCNEAQYLFFDYSNGILEEKTARYVRVHLEECSCCRQTYDFMRMGYVPPLQHQQTDSIEAPDDLSSPDNLPPDAQGHRGFPPGNTPKTASR